MILRRKPNLDMAPPSSLHVLHVHAGVGAQVNLKEESKLC